MAGSNDRIVLELEFITSLHALDLQGMVNTFSLKTQAGAFNRGKK